MKIIFFSIVIYVFMLLTLIVGDTGGWIFGFVCGLSLAGLLTSLNDLEKK